MGEKKREIKTEKGRDVGKWLGIYILEEEEEEEEEEKGCASFPCSFFPTRAALRGGSRLTFSPFFQICVFPSSHRVVGRHFRFGIFSCSEEAGRY